MPTDITSYSAEIALVGRKPQFNGLPASLFQEGAVPAERVYMNGGALVQAPAAAEGGGGAEEGGEAAPLGPEDAKAS